MARQQKTDQEFLREKENHLEKRERQGQSGGWGQKAGCPVRSGELRQGWLRAKLQMLLTGFVQTLGLLLGHRGRNGTCSPQRPLCSACREGPCPAIHACFLCFPSAPRPALCHRPLPGASHESTFLAFQPPPALSEEPHRAPFTARPSLPSSLPPSGPSSPPGRAMFCQHRQLTAAVENRLPDPWGAEPSAWGLSAGRGCSGFGPLCMHDYISALHTLSRLLKAVRTTRLCWAGHGGR